MKPVLRITDPTEIAVTASWDKVDTASMYKILHKSIVDDDIPWDKAVQNEFNSEQTSAEIDGLEPTTKYIFRLIAVTPEGESEMSDEVVIDTLVAGCGGSSSSKQKKSSCCIVQ